MRPPNTRKDREIRLLTSEALRLEAEHERPEYSEHIDDWHSVQVGIARSELRVSGGLDRMLAEHRAWYRRLRKRKNVRPQGEGHAVHLWRVRAA